MHKKELELRKQACGFNHEPHSILTDARIRHHVRPATQFMHDWMHGMVVGGVFQSVMGLVMDGLNKILPDMSATLQGYFETWTLPCRYNKKGLVDLFSAKRLKVQKSKRKHSNAQLPKAWSYTQSLPCSL